VDLDATDLADDPIEQFRLWFDAALVAGEAEPEAMALATASAAGRPSVRLVLMRGFDHRGWTFYTNSRSRKGAELAENAWAAAAFRWNLTGRQVRISGPVQKVEPAESDAYFATRARESQIGAWASHQSEVLADRAELMQRYGEVERRFAGAQVERPPWWGGYRVEPEEVEFWQQGSFRLHDRLRYRRDGSGWRLERLNP